MAEPLEVSEYLSLPSVPTFAAGNYAGSLRNAVLQIKHSRNRNVSHLLQTIGTGWGRWFATSGLVTDAVTVTPAPPSWKRRLTGQAVTWHLAVGVAIGLRAENIPAKVSDCLILPFSGGQAGKGAAGRYRRAQAGVRVLKSPHQGTILVDDIATTGATLAACTSALRRSGANPLLAAIIAIAMPMRSFTL
ncbi:MAG: hypothetical protein Q4A71_07580 [Actinomycetaceae bacterium]|nr:hypothetical protein [Actinomycetaceae bacterium]